MDKRNHDWCLLENDIVKENIFTDRVKKQILSYTNDKITNMICIKKTVHEDEL